MRPLRPPSESVVLIPVPEAEPLVSALRMERDPSARAGIPAHLTILWPFIPPDEITGEQVDDLENLLGQARRFAFTLIEVAEFEQGVVYLAPTPDEPFARLTAEVSERFGTLPFRGEHGPRPVPHLTVAINQPAAKRRQLWAMLTPRLPIHCQANEALLMTGNNATKWEVIRRMKFAE